MSNENDAELSAVIRSRATYHTAPPALRAGIANAVRRPAASQASVASFWRRPWLQIGLALACGALVGLLVVAPYDLSQREQIEREVVASHVRSLMLAHLTDLSSSDRHAVKPWFAGKLDFSPPVIDLADKGFPLIGGRLDYLDQRPVAALVYSHRKHTINLLIWPAGETSALTMTSRNGFPLARWSDSGMQFWAVSDLNPAELQSFVELLRSNHHP